MKLYAMPTFAQLKLEVLLYFNFNCYTLRWHAYDFAIHQELSRFYVQVENLYIDCKRLQLFNKEYFIMYILMTCALKCMLFLHSTENRVFFPSSYTDPTAELLRAASPVMDPLTYLHGPPLYLLVY